MPDKVEKMTARLDAHVKEADILLPHKNENYEDNVAGPWIGSDDTQISVSNKILHIKSIGPSPAVETVFTPNISDGTFYMEFEMKSNSHGEGTLSWKTAGDKEYEDEKNTGFESIHDGKWHSYKVQIPLGGRLKTLRIVPSEGKGDVELRNVKLVNKGGYYIRDWPMH